MTPVTARRLCAVGSLSGLTLHSYRAHQGEGQRAPVEAIAARLDLESRLRGIEQHAQGPHVKR
jgi:hypothetical protein